MNDGQVPRQWTRENGRVKGALLGSRVTEAHSTRGRELVEKAQLNNNVSAERVLQFEDDVAAADVSKECLPVDHAPSYGPLYGARR